MRCLTGCSWGLSNNFINTALIRSTIDFGCTVYGSAVNSQLKKLILVIQTQALRLYCKALRTSPISALQVEVGEMPMPL